MNDLIYDAKLILLCFFCGVASMFRRSTWRWMKETKDEEGFTWLEVIGVVFWNDWRLEQHYRRNGDW